MAESVGIDPSDPYQRQAQTFPKLSDDNMARIGRFGTRETVADGSSPFLTSREGVYAVGDVRATSVKRIASAVGEGSVVVASVHKWLEARDGQ